ncbi:hypothetical protein F5Y14DRAFT_403526 [Nemania sp. NC0429]|nr:hypothetical protein F5Y14DRAFT_403526 [Nemania sp. NC0429]
MAPYPPSSSARTAQLPSGYTTVDDILTQMVPAGRLVKVVGLVKDYRAPRATGGIDFKCTVTIYDKSVENDETGLDIHIFGRQDEMFEPAAGDVLVINSAKVQIWGAGVSLISSRSTSFHLYSAPDIPRPPASAKDALRPLPGTHQQLSEKVHEYVSWLYHFTNKNGVPDMATFQNLIDQSSHIKDKFCKLENVIERQFCDVIVFVVRAPFHGVDKTTLWVTDYTENDKFHKFSWDDKQLEERHDGPEATKWAGPFGKRSIQITCFEPAASQVSSEVQLGQWLRIRNLRIKLAKNALNLEGVLNEDRQFIRRQVEILPVIQDCEPRLKEAIRRKMEYEKLKKEQLKSRAANENRQGAAGTKRKASESKNNAKERRKEKRGAARDKVAQQDRLAEERLGLNDLVKCESQEQPVTPVSLILEPVFWKTTVQGEEVILTLPFACAKYRVNVRVVDFRPRKLQDFATWRQSTESDVLSDYSGDSSSGSDDDDNNEGRGSAVLNSGNKIWEWRFALQLEDADPKSKTEKDRFWAVVDNIEAQQLVGLDACDLREDLDRLDKLREQLFTLWGNLEEIQLQEQQRQIANQRRVAANRPPPSSSGGPENSDNEAALLRDGSAEEISHNGMQLSNKPFSCCIQQYGVRVQESDSNQAEAKDNREWVRVFGLFGTKISRI